MPARPATVMFMPQAVRRNGEGKEYQPLIPVLLKRLIGGPTEHFYDNLVMNLQLDLDI